MHYVIAGFKRVSTLIHILVLKVLYGKKFMCAGIGNIDNTSHFAIQDSGRIVLGKKIGMRKRCDISVSENGLIELNDNVFLNNQCMIVAHEHIKIGKGTRFGPDVKIYDHDYDIRNYDAYVKGKHKTAPIIIGDNCWIGAGSIILRGSELGNNCVIGAGCVIKGKYEKNSIIVQKRQEVVKINRE